MHNLLRSLSRTVLLVACSAVFFTGCKSAQKAASKPTAANAAARRPAPKKGGIKKFSDVIKKKAQKDEGLFRCLQAGKQILLRYS